MAFTKVVGAGIHTQSNIVSHNINSAGIITATKFDGPFDNIVIGGGGLNISGVVTSTGLDVNGNGDISGNLVIGGNLTANGDFTTLNTTLREVELLRVDADASVAAGIITQTGAGHGLVLADDTTFKMAMNVGSGIATFRSLNASYSPHNNAAGIFQQVDLNTANVTFPREISVGGATITTGNGSHRIRSASNDFAIESTTSSYKGFRFLGNVPTNTLVINASGGVGIGTDTTPHKLSVKGTISKISGTSGVQVINLTNDASQNGQILIQDAAGVTRTKLESNGVSYFRGTSVGIGSLTPAGKLDIAPGGNSFIKFGQDADNPKIELFRSTGSTPNTHYAVEFQQILGDFIFSTAGAAGPGSHSYSEKIRIKADGKIGIGTAIMDSSAEVSITNDSSSARVYMKSADNADCSIYFGRMGDSATGAIRYEHTDDSLKLYGYNNSERLVIDSSGHIIPGAAGTQNLGSTSKEWGNIYVGDSKFLYMGSDQDLSISHNGTHGYIHAATGGLYMKVANGEFLNRSGSQVIAKFLEGTGGVELYHNNIKKLDTVEKGIEVTGEVAASQDYPDIGPTVDLNFAATESLDPRIDFYRASAASYIDQNGKLVLVSPNTPRFVYDQTTKKCKGLLIETSGRNRVSSSGSNNGSATASGTVLGTAFTTNEIYHGIELPTGEIGTVRKLVSNSSGMRFGDYGGSANTSYTGSVWLRAVSGTANVYLDVNDSNTINPTLTEEWVRYSVTSATNNNYRFFDLYFANTQSVYMYGVQLEDSAYMTSYIPVYPNMSHGLRAPDYAVIDGQNFTDFYNPDESSVLAVGIPNRPAASQGQLNIFHIGDNNEDGHGVFREHGTKDPWYHIRNNNSTPTGGNLNPSGFGDWDAGEEARIAIAFKNGDQAISVNGGNQVTATVTSNYPTADITKMWIGSHGTGSFFEGTISRIAYYPKQLTDSQLNTLTAS